jgi:hypothetical protein
MPVYRLRPLPAKTVKGLGDHARSPCFMTPPGFSDPIANSSAGPVVTIPMPDRTCSIADA